MVRNHHILVSTFGHGAGVYLLDVERMEITDRVNSLATTGMDFSSRYWSLVRRLDPFESDHSEVVVGQRAKFSLREVPNAADAHGLMIRGKLAYLVSSYRATFHQLALDKDETQVVANFGGEADHWHPNDLCSLDGEIWATFFCDPTDGPVWGAEPHQRGFLMNLRTKAKIGAFTYPHSPTPAKEGIYVCDSGECAVVLIDRAGRERRRRVVSGFSRGLLVTKRFIFVGVSTHRLVQRATPGATESRIHVLDRQSLSEISVVDVPATEVYSITRARAWQVKQLRSVAI